MPIKIAKDDPKLVDMKKRRYTTPVGNVLFADHCLVKKDTGGGNMKYQLTLILDIDADTSDLEKAIDEMAEYCWGKDRPKDFFHPIQLGDEQDKPLDQMKGKKFLRLKSDFEPGICDAQLQPITDPKDWYSGCFVRATFNIFPFHEGKNAGISLGLNNIQKCKDGPRWSGVVAAENDFSTYSEE